MAFSSFQWEKKSGVVPHITRGTLSSSYGAHGAIVLACNQSVLLL